MKYPVIVCLAFLGTVLGKNVDFLLQVSETTPRPRVTNSDFNMDVDEFNGDVAELFNLEQLSRSDSEVDEEDQSMLQFVSRRSAPYRIRAAINRYGLTNNDQYLTGRINEPIVMRRLPTGRQLFQTGSPLTEDEALALRILPQIQNPSYPVLLPQDSRAPQPLEQPSENRSPSVIAANIRRNLLGAFDSAHTGVSTTQISGVEDQTDVSDGCSTETSNYESTAGHTPYRNNSPSRISRLRRDDSSELGRNVRRRID